MQRWIFETPWWLLAAIAVAAVALLVSGNNRQNRRVTLAGVGVLLAGAILWAVSYFVQTPREIAIARTRQAVAAIVAKDRTTLDRLLHPTAVLMGWGRNDILDGAMRYADQYALQSAYVTGIDDTDASESNVTVVVSVLSRHDSKQVMVDTVPSTWQLQWMDTSDGWRLRQIDPIRILSMDRSQLPGGLFGR